MRLQSVGKATGPVGPQRVQREGTPSVRVTLRGHPDAQVTWKQQGPLSAELHLEILARREDGGGGGA